MSFLSLRIAKFVLAIGISVAGTACYADPRDFTYSDWQQMSEQWKRGYLYAVMNFQTQVKQSESEADLRLLMGYRACTINKLTDAAFVVAVNSYFIRHPEAITETIIGVAINTLREICDPYLGQK